MGNIVVELSSEEAGLFQAITKASKAMGGLERNTSKQAKAAREAARANAKMARDGKRMTEALLTPQERYNRKLAEARKLLQGNHIGLATYSRRVSQLRGELRGAQKGMGAAFGRGAIGMLKSTAAGILGIGAAVAVVKQTMSDIAARNARAAEESRFASMGRGALGQVATGRMDRRAMIKRAQNFYAQGGSATLDEAYRTQFALRSAGFDDAMPLYRKLRASRLVESPDELSLSAKTMYSTVGKSEIGSMRDLMSKMFAASAHTTTTAESLLRGASRGGQLAASLGVSDEELLALQAMTSSAAGSSEMGATQTEGLLNALEKAGMGADRGSLLKRLQTVQSVGLESQSYGKAFGDKEAKKGFRSIMQTPELTAKYQTALADISAAAGRDEVGMKLQMNLSDANIRANIQADKSKAREVLSEETLGDAALLANAAQSDLAVRQRQSGWSEKSITLSRMADNVNRWLTMDDEQWLASNVEYAAGDTKATVGDDRRMGAAADSMKDVADQMYEQSAGGANLAPRGEDR